MPKIHAKRKKLASKNQHRLGKKQHKLVHQVQLTGKIQVESKYIWLFDSMKGQLSSQSINVFYNAISASKNKKTVGKLKRLLQAAKFRCKGSVFTGNNDTTAGNNSFTIQWSEVSDSEQCQRVYVVSRCSCCTISTVGSQNRDKNNHNNSHV